MKYLDKKEGSIFFIPLFLPNGIKDNRKSYSRTIFEADKKYSFGRLIETNDSSGDLVEIFNYIGEIPVNKSIIIESGLLFNPLHVSMGFLKKRWRFIFDDINYNRIEDSNYDEITFLLGDRDDPILWKGGRKQKIKENINEYDEWIVYPPTELEDLIRDELKNKS